MDKKQLNLEVLKWIEGDLSSFSVLYDYYVDKIFRFIYFKVPGDHAEDLTEDVFVKVMEKKHSFDPLKSSFSTWIYTIARNTVIDFFRTNKQTNELSEYVEDTNPNVKPDVLASKKIETQNLRKALKTLPKDKQDLVILRFIDELSYQEMSQILGKSEGSIRITMMRALRDLRTVLEKLET